MYLRLVGAKASIRARHQPSVKAFLRALPQESDVADNYPHPQRIVRERERREITGVSTSSWYKLMAEGRAPRPVRISEAAVGWLHSELQEFIEQRRAERDAKAAAQ
jgi:prophage regulatory protein